MPRLDHKGPEGKGSRTGRSLGKCQKGKDPALEEMGGGLGFKRRSGGGKGKGKRLKSSNIFDKPITQNNEDCSTNKE